jgi:alpha-beta hydrolase superfamily lysophospholipase
MEVALSIIGISAIATLIYVILAQLILYRVYVYPSRLHQTSKPSDFDLDYIDLDIQSEDIINPGWLIYPPNFKQGEKRNLVIIPHGYSAERSDVLPRCNEIARAGYLVYTFDWRAHGENREKRCSGGINEQKDLDQIIDYLQGMDYVHEIALYGYSMAASISILVAARRTEIPCIVADSPFDTLENAMKDILRRFPLGESLIFFGVKYLFNRQFEQGFNSVNAAERVRDISPRPLMVLTGTNDTIVHHRLSMSVYKAAGEPKTLHIQEGGGHFDNASTFLLRDRIIPFFLKHMPPEPASND